jgi:hypothetical protein
MRSSLKTAGATIVTACVLSLIASTNAYAADPPPIATPAPPPPPAAAPAPPAAAPAATPSEPVAPTPAEVKYRRMAVEVTSTRPDAVLERRVNVKETNGAFLVLPWHDSESTWEQVCVAPCRGADFDRYSTYRVSTMNGISSSSSFTLPQTDAMVHLELRAGDRRANRAGVALGAGGFAALVVGGSLLIAGENVDDHDGRIRTRNAGFIVGAAGIVMMAIGIPLAIMSRTYVYADDQPVRVANTKPRFIGNGFVF